MIIRKEVKKGQRCLCKGNKIRKNFIMFLFCMIIILSWNCEVDAGYLSVLEEVYDDAHYQKEELEWNWVVKPGEYEECLFLGEEFIAVKKKNGFYGVIDKTGAFVFSDEYEEIGHYCEGIARVCNKETVFFIDQNGKRITQKSFQDAHSFQEGKAVVMLNNDLWGFIDKNEKMITTFQYDEVRDFQESYAAARKINGDL